MNNLAIYGNDERRKVSSPDFPILQCNAQHRFQLKEIIWGYRIHWENVCRRLSKSKDGANLPMRLWYNYNYFIFVRFFYFWILLFYSFFISVKFLPSPTKELWFPGFIYFCNNNLSSSIFNFQEHQRVRYRINY